MTAAETIKFNRRRDGRYVEPMSGLELVKGIDDSDGYDRIEWQIWTANMDRPLGTCDSLHAAKRQARVMLTTHGWWSALLDETGER